MNIDNTTHRHIIREAQNNGICAAWLQDMKGTDDTRQLFDMYIRGIDFCLQHEYPDMDTMRRYQAAAQAAGIFVDCDGMRTSNPARTVCLGETVGLIKYDGHHAGAVYIKHGSSVTLVATGNSFVMVDIFDNASLLAEAWDDAQICVNLYQEDGTEGPKLIDRAHDKARIKVINKHKKSYK